ncbi:hypothetical protein ACFWG9_28610, partial [Streptomyces sp. NPDC060333]
AEHRVGQGAATPGRSDGGGPGSAATGPATAGPARAAPRDRRAEVEAAWFASDDVMPFVAMVTAFLGRGFGKGARVLRGFPEQGRRTARAVVRAPRQRGREQASEGAGGPAARPAPPEAAEPDELVSR